MEKIILPVTGNKQKIISRVTEVSLSSKYYTLKYCLKFQKEETAYRNDGSNNKLYTAYCICDITR